MAKAFRNTGIEGGYGTLEKQNWLLGVHRSMRAADKVTGENTPKWNSISAAKQKPVKDSAAWRFAPNAESIALLMRYADSSKPEFLGSWSAALKLHGIGLLQLVEPPNRWVSKADGSYYAMGAKFEITVKGREYVKWLKANPNQ